MVAIHFCARAIPDEEHRFGTGSHLRTVYSAITPKIAGVALRRPLCWFMHWLGNFLCQLVLLVTLIAVPADGDNDE